LFGCVWAGFFYLFGLIIWVGFILKWFSIVGMGWHGWFGLIWLGIVGTVL
jgi:hypothetical protein